MDQVARAFHPEAKVGKGSELFPEDQGLKVLGTLLGHPEYVAAHLQKTMDKHRIFFQNPPRSSVRLVADVVLCVSASKVHVASASTRQGFQVCADARRAPLALFVRGVGDFP